MPRVVLRIEPACPIWGEPSAHIDAKWLSKGCVDQKYAVILRAHGQRSAATCLHRIKQPLIRRYKRFIMAGFKQASQVTHLARTRMMNCLMPWHIRIDDGGSSPVVHLPDVIVSIGMTTGSIHHGPVCALAHIEVIKPIGRSGDSCIVEAHRDLLIPGFTIQCWLDGLQIEILLNKNTIEVISCRVGRLVHIEVQPRGFVEMGGRLAGSAGMKGDEMLSPIAFPEALCHTVEQQ